MIEGLYIHIPFCNVICSYCDFYKMRAKSIVKEQLVDYLIEELYLKREYLNDLQTIYIGGGTPSSLDHNLLEKLFKSLDSLIDSTKIKEFTIEANPNDININFINLIKKYKINRLSLGIQSFDRQTLQILGRNHTEEEAINALSLLQKENFPNVNIDLIYGLQTDTFARVKNDIDIAIKYNVKHFSIYSLIVEEKTLFGYLSKKNQFQRLDDLIDAKIYEQLVDYLQINGYLQYEVSNFAKIGYQSIHNLIYWNNNHYIAVGPSASYFIDNTRYTNINNLQKYFDGVKNKDLCFLEKRHITKEDQMIEEVIMGFRKVEGINKKVFYKKYGISILEAFPKINNLIRKGIIIDNNDFVHVRKDKLFVLNAILVSIL